jgi:hypothetical protein
MTYAAKTTVVSCVLTEAGVSRSAHHALGTRLLQ